MKRIQSVLLPKLAWAPLIAFSTAMIVLYVRGSPKSHESPSILFACNLIFTSLVSAFIAVLTGRSFLVLGRPALLATCTGMIVWGASAFVAVVGERPGNYNLTIHNLGIAVSGVCHFLGGLAAYRYRDRSCRDTGAWLSVGIALSSCAVGAIWMGAQQNWFPPFYVEGAGATALRTATLVVAVTMFVAASQLTWLRFRASNWPFLYWHALALALIAVGAAGLVLQPTHGSWLGWVSRGAQYLGGLYMLVGTIVTRRKTGGWDLTLEERLVASERAQRAQQDLIRTINDNTNELIFMKNREGRLTYANAATLRLTGLTELPADVLDRELFDSAEEHDSVARNDRRVMETGKTIEVEEIFTGADGRKRTFLSTKSPLRDAAGEIIGVIGVSRDITERTAAQEALRSALDVAESARAALAEADQRKNEFLAVLAHELRGPLAPLQNMVEILKRPGGDDVVRTDGLVMIERQLGQLVRLVDDLIDVSRITSDKIVLRKSATDLASILEQSIEACRPLADRKQQRILTRLPDHPVRLLGDPARLAQVFGNLLNNASKYSDPGRDIWITADDHGDHVDVVVKDAGMGISSEHLGRIFDMFTQIDRTHERSQGGLGIGLSLVRRLVDMHGGTVTAHSEGPGRGSAFTVRLPVLERQPVRSPANEPVPEAPSCRILVVDDNADSASSLALLLQTMGHTTRIAQDGSSALAEAQSFAPDVVLLDIGLPGFNGFEVCSRIRAQPWGREMFIIALTGWGQDEDRRKSSEVGFDAHFVKPVDWTALAKLLTSRFGTRTD